MARQPTVIAPSILSANFARLGDDVARVVAAGADWIHFAVMDNHYVPNLTFGPMICEALKPFTGQALMDVHLMVDPVDALVPMFAKAGAGLISFHPEASRHVDRTLALVRDQGCQAGLVFNPATPLAWAAGRRVPGHRGQHGGRRGRKRCGPGGFAHPQPLQPGRSGTARDGRSGRTGRAWRPGAGAAWRAALGGRGDGGVPAPGPGGAGPPRVQDFTNIALKLIAGGPSGSAGPF